jgi:hypothetical protein
MKSDTPAEAPAVRKIWLGSESYPSRSVESGKSKAIVKRGEYETRSADVE